MNHDIASISMKVANIRRIFTEPAWRPFRP